MKKELLLPLLLVLLSSPALAGHNDYTGILPVENGGTGSENGNGLLNSYLAPRLVVTGDSITAGSTANVDTSTAAGVNQGYGQSFANLAPFLAN